jgi:hypothetical protein
VDAKAMACLRKEEAVAAAATARVNEKWRSVLHGVRVRTKSNVDKVKATKNKDM